MNKKNVKLWIIKGMYILGIVLDGFCAIEMFTGAIMKDQSPFLGFAYSILGGGPIYQYVMFIAASFMLGWTLLLVWGLFKPIERKEVLLITWLPVVIGLGISHFIAYSYGIYIVSDLVIRATINGFLNIGLVVSYILARSLKK